MKLDDRAHIQFVAGALAEALEPPQSISLTAWAKANLSVPDGPRQGEKWDPSLTPYIIEPLEMLGPDSPVNEIASMKSAQTAFTTMLIAAIGHSIDLDPCNLMIIQPTESALQDFNRDKLHKAIEGSPTLKAKVKPQVSRSGEGSTTYSKLFRGGSLTMAIGSSAADLRSKTIKKLFRDEIDEYPEDLDGQGDPLEISKSRQDSFLAGGEWKRVDISTPTIKGASQIEKRFMAGDQRYWNVPCPHCGEWFVFEYGPHFRHNKGFPFGAHYAAPCCGSIINASERDGLVRKGKWVPRASRPGAFPSYHFNALSSPFVPWDTIAERAVSSASDPKAQKAFYNLTLGLPFEIKGDAPSHKLLMQRSEDYGPRGHIPADGLILTAAADVQMRGIWYEVVAWGADRQSWVVDADYLDGPTDSVDGGAFELLAKVLDSEWPDAFGGTRKLDALGVDSGYRTHVVYTWARSHDFKHPDSGQSVVLALDGRDGWGKQPIGTPRLVDVDLEGRKIRKGVRLWPVGTWPLKAAAHADMEKLGKSSRLPEDPPGFCHFAKWLDETYFKQITSESLIDSRVNGKTKKVWKIHASEKDNHLFDCRVYNMALAEYLGLSRWTPREVLALSRARGLKPLAPPVPTSAPLPEDEEAQTFRAPSIQAPPSEKPKKPGDDDEDEFDKLASRNSEFW